MTKLNPTAQAILYLVHGYLTKKHKGWSLISQAWMLDTLADWYKIKISRSTLNYNLALLRTAGLIETQKRHKRGDNGELICRVTLYKLTKKMRSFFYKVSRYFHNIGWKHLKRQTRTFLDSVTKKPEAPDIGDQVEPWEIKAFIQDQGYDDTPLSFAKC